MSGTGETPSSIALETEGLGVAYGRTRVLEGVSLAVPRGSVFALLGRNGSGKTSLLRCLLGQRPVAAGRASVLGQDPWRHRRKLMERIGVVPEEPGAFPEMTPRQLSSFCERLHGRWDTEAVEERFRRFEVPLDQPFGRLSKGQKGAVMLTLGLGHDPELLVLDDPTLGLDVVARDTVFREVIGDLADRGTTVFVTTHELRAIEGLADHVAILHGGRLALNGSLESVKAEWSRPLEEIFAAVAGPDAAATAKTEVSS
jgi:ABC-2 type transport system ATP-binding protein